ncbi:hypothetical protein [Burkholderia sp. AU45388]|uniref:hypothetical protein n=1 Tax=Burkholderia sp. AU45388 TaxID=3059206 RepID=UPI0026532451|nr:hypothetical protein [Burkholderia sp. AU45388]MDN7430409.1 hypothetical protein [Burkholderia sp. AU45388]
MNPGSIDNWFALPPPRAASYLPAPYGVRRGVPGQFAHLSPGGVYLPAPRSRRGVAVAAAAGAADFGHDNLAWSRTPPPRGRGRVMLAAIGGALLGTALTVLFGGMLADRWAEFGRMARGRLPEGSAGSASIVAAAAESAATLRPASASDPASASSLASAFPAASAPASISMPSAGQSGMPPDPPRRKGAHAVPALRLPPPRTSDMAGMSVRERQRMRPVPVRTVLPSMPAKLRSTAPVDTSDTTSSGAPAPCGADWPCGDALRSLQAELKQWEAARQSSAPADSRAEQMPVRLTDHPRVTEW